MSHLQYRPASGPADAESLIAIHAACTAVEGAPTSSSLEDVPMLDEYRHLLATTDPEHWVVAEADGQVAGYGHALWEWPERDGTHVYLHLGSVAPEWRGRGIGTELLARLEACCRQRAQTDGNLARAEFAANAAETELTACELLRANGYGVGYTMLAMRYTGGTITSLPLLPEKYTLRPVEPEHHRAIWQCIGDAYDADNTTGRYATEASEGSLRGYLASENADPSLWFVAWCGSRIAGQVLCRIQGDIGTVYEVSIGSAHRRQGLAAALLIRGIQALQARGVASILIHTRQEFPTQAWRLYEKCGFETFKRFPRWRKGFE